MSSLIGKWITVGETIATHDTPRAPDSCQRHLRSAGGRPILCGAHGVWSGIAGYFYVGGIEIIGYDPATGRYKTHFFDSEGNISNQDLTFKDGTWTRSGDNARAVVGR